MSTTKEQFEKDLDIIFKNLKDLLISKHKSYGNSVFEPVRIFSKSDSIEQIKVRIDDKLSRIAKGNDFKDEDVIDDLMGYLIILKIGMKNGK